MSCSLVVTHPLFERADGAVCTQPETCLDHHGCHVERLVLRSIIDDDWRMLGWKTQHHQFARCLCETQAGFGWVLELVEHSEHQHDIVLTLWNPVVRVRHLEGAR